jgi:benzodiazapine receptor
MQNRVARWLIPLAVVGVIGFNGVAQWLPLNGRSTGEISDDYRVYITPAGYVFAIWSLIYAGLIAFAVYRARTVSPSERIDTLTAPFLVSCVANAGWLALWHYGFVGASLLAMLTLLGSLVVIYVRLRREPPQTSIERWCVDRPFSVYLGWVTIATLVNLSVVLEAFGARPFGLDAPGWALVMLFAALVIAVAVTRLFGDRWILGVFLWAAIGIAIAPEQARSVTIGAALLAGTTILLASLAPRLQRRDRLPTPSPVSPRARG